MILLLTLSAYAGTCITINGSQCHATLADAVAAAGAGATVGVPAGRFEAGIQIDTGLTIRGAGAAQTTLFSSTVSPTVWSDATTTVALEGLALETSAGGAAGASQGSLILSDVDVVSLASLNASGYAIAHDGGTLTLRDVVFEPASTAGGLVDSNNTDVSLERISAASVQLGATPGLRATGGSWDWIDVDLDAMTATSSFAVATGVEDIQMRRVRSACAASTSPLFDLQATTVSIGPMLIWKSAAPALLALDVTGQAPGDVGFSTLIAEPGGYALDLRGIGATWSLHDSVITADTAVNSPGANVVQGTYTLYNATQLTSGSISGSPLLGAGTTRETPEFLALDMSATCGADILAPLDAGNLVDTGNPAATDRDSTQADRGATGGPDGFVLIHDEDADGFSELVDCDDTDASVFPGANEIPFDGIDQDCDGADLADGDGDGVNADEDCDDEDDSVYPGATERADSVDHDCDGYADPAMPPTFTSCSTIPTNAGYPLFAVFLMLRRRRNLENE